MRRAARDRILATLQRLLDARRTGVNLQDMVYQKLIYVAVAIIIGSHPAVSAQEAPASPPAQAPASAPSVTPSAGGAATGAAPRNPLWHDWRAPFEEPISTDRPDFTESTSVLPRGRFQLESGYTYTTDRESGRRSRDHVFPEFLLRSGVVRDWELRLGWEGFSLTEESFRARNEAGRTRTHVDHDDAGSDMNVGFKTSLLESVAGFPDVSVIGVLSLPSGADGKTSGDVDPEVKLLWGYDLTEQLGLAGNFNLGVPSDDQGRLVQAAASVSLAYALTDYLGTYVEYIGVYPNQRDADCAHTLNGGFTIQLSDHVQLDLRAGFGLNEEADDFFTGVGFAFRF